MIPTVMEAIQISQFGDPDVLAPTTLPVPTLTDDTLLIRVHAIGINPVDTYIRSGTYAFKPDLPYTPGTDAAGVVVAVGRHVNGFSVGDRVYTTSTLSGACAEYALCQPQQLFHLPANISFAQGAALGVPAATAWRALFISAQAQAGQTLLIHGGSGAVGTCLLQLAKAAGLSVIATAGSTTGQQHLLTLGADQVYNHHHDDYLALLADNPPNLIIDMLASANLARDLTMIAKGGTIVVVGNRGTVEINPRLLMQKEATLKGVLLFAASDDEYQKTHQGIMAALKNGTLTPVIGDQFSLAQAADAHIATMTPGHYGKIVISIP